MNDKEYYDWFVANAELFAQVGVMHPNSEWGKLIKICIYACEERIRVLEQRIDELEKASINPANKRKRSVKNEG